jgi:hypothetical protein
MEIILKTSYLHIQDREVLLYKFFIYGVEESGLEIAKEVGLCKIH